MTSPDQYTPRSPSLLDAIAHAKRTADAIVRNNPLTNATVTQGLMKWLGNYTTAEGEPVPFVWIGEVLPLDPVMGKEQNSFVLWRDDITQGSLAFGLYDPFPNSGGSGLRQALYMQGGDIRRLWQESRDWGMAFPRDQVAMGERDWIISNWAGTPDPAADANWYTIHEGRMNVVGNLVEWRYWCSTTAGGAGETRLRIDAHNGQPDLISPVTVLGVTTSGFSTGTLDVRVHRGSIVTVRLEARVTNGTGRCHIANVATQCYTP